MYRKKIYWRENLLQNAIRRYSLQMELGSYKKALKSSLNRLSKEPSIILIPFSGHLWIGDICSEAFWRISRGDPSKKWHFADLLLPYTTKYLPQPFCSSFVVRIVYLLWKAFKKPFIWGKSFRIYSRWSYVLRKPLDGIFFS